MSQRPSRVEESAFSLFTKLALASASASSNKATGSNKRLSFLCVPIFSDSLMLIFVLIIILLLIKNQ
jgi:hypothetical protein